MTSYDNQPPELTPDWSCEARPDPFAAGMSRDECRSAFESLMADVDLPEATWSEPGDLGRMSIDSMASRDTHIPPNIVLGAE